MKVSQKPLKERISPYLKTPPRNRDIDVRNACEKALDILIDHFARYGKGLSGLKPLHLVYYFVAETPTEYEAYLKLICGNHRLNYILKSSTIPP